MGVSKIKNLVIAALVLLNVFFLIVIAIDRGGDAQRERQALEDACAVLARAEITLDPGDVNVIPGLRAMKTARDLASQRTIAEAVLGDVTETEQGEIVYRYDNERTGNAIFKSGGEFTVTINEEVYPAASDVAAVARGLMRDMGIEPIKFETAYSTASEQTVTALCSYRGARIFNCTVSFRFVSGSLRGVSGKYASGVTETEDAETIASPATALMAFLSAVKRDELSCGQIYQVTAGYFARDATAFGDGELAPAWLVETNSGRYVVDTGTGEIRVVPD